MTGCVFNIQRFSINDGPGIRTTVFLKGCPLRCLWCHNPESARAVPELLYDEERCVSCGRCITRCEHGGHEILDFKHHFKRDVCIGCGACIQPSCPALELAGKKMTTEEVIEEVMKDEAFYKTSNGGMTISGGEPMAQFEFTLELLKLAKENRLHTCIETCGYCDFEKLERAAEYVDIFLYDYKETDNALHQKFTGVSNKRIHDNLRKLDKMGAKTVLRCPIIPTLNDREDHFAGIAAMANELTHVMGVDVEPYHPLGSSKCTKLGREYELAELKFPESETVKSWIAAIAEKTYKEVRKA